MFKSGLLIFAVLLSDLITVPLFAQTATKPSGGNGSSSNPYQISTLDNLYWIASDSVNWKYHYVQTADINAAKTKIWFAGQGWKPIGQVEPYFTGSYNGKGHFIDSLFINRPVTFIGFFGHNSNSTVDSLGLSNVNFKGGDFVGGLVANQQGGSISNSYSTGMITGASNVGGMVGALKNGSIKNSFSTVTVTCTNNGTSALGGLVGTLSSGNIRNSYSTGIVTTANNVIYSDKNKTLGIGGLVGSNNGGIVYSSFWDTLCSKINYSWGGTPKTTAQMKMKSTYTDSGWNFVGETSNSTKDIWEIDSSFNNGYPFLAWQTNVPRITPILIPVNPDPTNNQKPTFKWFSVKEIAIYRLQISSNEQFSSPIISIPTSDTSYIPLINLPYGTIFWRVCNESDTTRWSTKSSFTIIDSLTPLLISYTPDPTINRNPKLMWYKVKNASSYSIQVSASVSFAATLISDVVSDTSYMPLTKLPVGKIFWRVKSDIGNQYSLIDSITILNDSIPFLISMNPDTQSNTKPTFVWFSAAGASSYKIQIDTSNSFSNPYISVPVSDTVYVPSANLPYGKIFWRISASTNPNQFSQIDSFVVVTTGVISHSYGINSPSMLDVINQKKHITIAFSIKTPEDVSLHIITLSGVTVASINIGMVSKGRHTFQWDMRDKQGRALSQGIYLLTCKLNGITVSRKLTIK